MAINKVNTIDEEQNFDFLTNQSSILYTSETEDTIVNGVNVIVDKPKKGDIMCITRYEKGRVILGADHQKVVWIDGLTINLKQLFKKYEAVGICLNVKGNKALVRYKTEKALRWSAVDRWEIPNSSIMNDLGDHTIQIVLRWGEYYGGLCYSFCSTNHNLRILKQKVVQIVETYYL